MINIILSIILYISPIFNPTINQQQRGLSCEKYTKLSNDIINTNDVAKRDEIISLLIRERKKCPEQFKQFARERAGYLNEQHRIFMAKCVDSLITQDKGLLDEFLSVIPYYNYRKYQYRIAKKVDPDFFKEFEQYYLNDQMGGTNFHPCRIFEKDLFAKFKPIKVLINLGDSSLENQMIYTTRLIYDSLSNQALARYSEIKDSTIKQDINISKASRFVKFLSAYVFGIRSFRTLDALFYISRYRLSESFLSNKDKRYLSETGRLFLEDFLTPNLSLEKAKTAREKYRELYYVCPDYLDPYMCKDSWKEALNYYRELRSDKRNWRKGMF